MKADEMYGQPLLHKCGEGYYFRTKVPVDLLPFYLGAEIKFSLRTRDKQVAWQRVQLESLRLDREFDMRRKTGGDVDAPLSMVNSINDKLKHQSARGN